MRPPNAIAGKLRDVIAWETPTRAASATGQVVVTWADAGTQRCHVEAVSGLEKVNADQPLPQHSHRVTVRCRTNDIRHDWRGLWTPRGGVERALNVVVVLPADTGEDWQVVLCQEQAPTTEDV